MERSEEAKFDLTKLQEADVEKHFILTPEERSRANSASWFSHSLRSATRSWRTGTRWTLS